MPQKKRWYRRYYLTPEGSRKFRIVFGIPPAASEVNGVTQFEATAPTGSERAPTLVVTNADRYEASKRILDEKRRGAVTDPEKM